MLIAGVWSGSKSMMMLNVSHKLASANHEKTSENVLYCNAS